ncbi:hypothetical protein [Clostridium sporogenes]|uniref:hypothetical protein n=1 Tax=Clostridium sporogenes TaxID=1509 RepID=UPI0013D121FD|nr:hypothetical protein [Clostridium sporogenes]NFP92117.1 hypothetical protein [Clostridium sporogenes]
MGNLHGIAPQNIKLLFENEQLNIIKVLSLLQVLRNRSKKKFYTVEDVIFYYSLVNFDLIKLLYEDVNNLMKNRNRYLRFNKSINQIILELSNLKYIDIKGNLFSKKEHLGIRLNEEGEAFINTFDSEYFIHLAEIYINVLIDISNNSVNKNKIKGLLK